MKIFHLSDLHIGLKLMNRDLAEDQAYIFDQIAQLAHRHRPDAILIAGDIYDKAVPAAEAVELFDHFIRELTEAVPESHIMLISGNHDSAKRVNVFRSVLEKQRIHMIGAAPALPEEYIEKVTLSDSFGQVHFYLLPFVRPSMVRLITGQEEDGSALSYDEALHRLIGREQIDRTQRNVLVSHQFYLPEGVNADDIERMDSEVCSVGNIDAVRSDVLRCFDYAALGHIHKPMKVGGEQWRYCGTPLACSVSEAGQKKGIVMVDLRARGDVRIEVLPLKPLREVRVIRGPLSEVLEQACPDFVTAVLTDKEDLEVLDMQDRLREAFPMLLEIRRENTREAFYASGGEPLREADPYEMCCSFLKSTDEKEQELLRNVINSVQMGDPHFSEDAIRR